MLELRWLNATALAEASVWQGSGRWASRLCHTLWRFLPPCASPKLNALINSLQINKTRCTGDDWSIHTD